MGLLLFFLVIYMGLYSYSVVYLGRVIQVATYFVLGESYGSLCSCFFIYVFLSIHRKVIFIFVQRKVSFFFLSTIRVSSWIYIYSHTCLHLYASLYTYSMRTGNFSFFPFTCVSLFVICHLYGIPYPHESGFSFLSFIWDSFSVFCQFIWVSLYKSSMW